MFEIFDREFDKVMDQDTAVLEALSKVDHGLFDTPEGRDEDLDALYEDRKTATTR